MFNRLASFILRNRPIIIIAFLLVTLVMAFFGSQVKLSYENNKLVPKDDKDLIAYQKFTQEFGDDGNKMVVGFASDSLFTPFIYNAFYEACAQTIKIKGVTNLLSVTHFYTLYKDEENARFKLIQLPHQQPTNHSEVRLVQMQLDSLGLYKEVLYNPDKKATVAFITLDINILNSEERLALIADIKTIFKKFEKQTNTSVALSGIPYVRNEFANTVKNEFMLFTLLAIGITAVFLWFFFRSFTNILIPLILVGMSVVWSLGFIHLFGYKLTILTGIIPPLMVVIGIPNCIYLLNKYHAEFRKHGNKIKSLTRIIAKVGPANVLTNFTTGVGFGVFYFTNTSLLTQFGVVTFFSVLAISLITVILLPIIYSFLPAPSIKQTKHLENKQTNKFVENVHHLVFNKRRVIYFFASVLVVLSIIGISKLKPLVYVVDDIPKDTKIYKDLKFFETNFKGIMPLEIIIDSGEEGGIKQTATLQKISTLQKRLADYDELTRPVSVVDLLSAANQSWNKNNPKYYRLPNKTSLASISNYLAMNDSSQQVNMVPVDKVYRKARISIQMADVGSNRMKTLSDEIQVQLNDIFPKEQFLTRITGTSYLFMIGNGYLLNSLFQSVLIAFILIAIIMGALFTSFKMVLVSLVPNAIPLLITAGIMGWANVPLKPSTILVFSIAFGIAIDDTIHFLAKFRQELKQSARRSIHKSLSVTLKETGTSLVYTSVVLFFGFIIFGFSEFQGTVALGILTSLSLFFALFANIFVLPALILSFEKRLNPRLELKESVLELPDENEDE